MPFLMLRQKVQNSLPLDGEGFGWGWQGEGKREMDDRQAQVLAPGFAVKAGLFPHRGPAAPALAAGGFEIPRETRRRDGASGLIRPGEDIIEISNIKLDFSR